MHVNAKGGSQAKLKERLKGNGLVVMAGQRKRFCEGIWESRHVYFFVSCIAHQTMHICKKIHYKLKWNSCKYSN